MKIVHVIATLDPRTGGPAAVAIRLAAAQAELGHDVHILSYGTAEIAERARLSAALIPHLDDVHLHRIEPPGLREMLTAAEAHRAFRSLAHDAEFVHAHGVWEPLIRRATKTARQQGIPYCVRPAGMLDRWSLDQKKWKKRLALALGYKEMLNQAAFIQLLSDDEIEAMNPLGITAPIHVIPNGVFVEEVRPLAVKGRFKSSRPELGQRRFVLFLSRLHHKKGLDILIDAFALVAAVAPDVDLVVAGPDFGIGNALRQHVCRKGLEGRVHVVGPLYGSEKYAALADAECFCLPSRQEGFSVAVIEALACGVPVVISQFCHFPELGLASAGVITSLSPAAVADGLLDILSSPEKAVAMSERARALVASRYTWQIIARRTVETYLLVSGIAEVFSGLPPF